jgi:hypothetical protein
MKLPLARFGVAIETPLLASISAGRAAGDTSHSLPKASGRESRLQSARAEVDFYANDGHGFHSNDVRGVFATPRVSPLTRAIGEELGTRARLFGFTPAYPSTARFMATLFLD